MQRNQTIFGNNRPGEDWRGTDRPDGIGSGDRVDKSRLIGLLVDRVTDPFFLAVGSIIEAEMKPHGCTLFYASTNNDGLIARDLLAHCRSMHADGYIIAPPLNIRKEVEVLMDEGCPVVLFDRLIRGLDVPGVVLNNFESTYSSVMHLIRGGYRRIGLVTFRSKQEHMEGRLAGYLGAMQEGGLTPLVLELPDGLADPLVVASISSFLRGAGEPDAVVFATHRLTQRGLFAIRLSDLPIPGRVGVVGFDHGWPVPIAGPAITVIMQPVEEIAREIVRLLLAGLSGGQHVITPTTTVLPARLIVRGSSAPGVRE